MLKINQPFTCILANVPLKELNTSVTDQTFAESKGYEFCSYIVGRTTPTSYRILIFSTLVPHQKKSELKNSPN